MSAVLIAVLRFAALAVLLTASATAGASSLYRCVGKHGEVAFTSNRAGYSQCTEVRVPTQATTAPALAAPAGAGPAPAATQPRIDFRTAPGDAPPPAPANAGATRSTSGAVHRYVKNGVTHYTNRPPPGQRTQIVFTYIENCFACGLRSSVDFHTVRLNTTDYLDEIAAAAAAEGIDAAFVRAIVHAESAFNPNALSNKGAQGLMQLMPATAARFGVDDAFSAGDNIRGGTKYLAWLLRRFDGDTRLAAAGYNAGEGAVDRFGGVPPYQETQNFVERVGILHQRYSQALAALPLRAPVGGVGAAAGAAP